MPVYLLLHEVCQRFLYISRYDIVTMNENSCKYKQKRKVYFVKNTNKITATSKKVYFTQKHNNIVVCDIFHRRNDDF